MGASTYILKCQNLYKIGKSKNVDERIKTHRMSNPFLEHISTIGGDYEGVLHDEFKNKRRQGEWFVLTDDDLKRIPQIIENIELVKRQFKQQHVDIQNPKKENVVKTNIPNRPIIRLRYDHCIDTWVREKIIYND